MNCMKCGRDIPEGQVFCPGCLEVMCKYPIVPGTPVQLPRRTARSQEKKAAKEAPPQEQIATLKKTVRWLWVTIAVLLAACGILALLLTHAGAGAAPQLPTGRNYTTAPHLR